MSQTQPALVLLGPTGSGKTPLGTEFQKMGFRGQRCIHFDFGQRLRQIVAEGQRDAIVSQRDIEFLREVLATGALLEDRDFPIAQRVLSSFLRHEGANATTWVVMNGLPRHVGQAKSLASSLHVEQVIVLQCTPEVVVQRIASNAGGDRCQRVDDDLEAIERKLTVFAQRTVPLATFFREQGAVVTELVVSATMTAAEMWGQLAASELGA